MKKLVLLALLVLMSANNYAADDDYMDYKLVGTNKGMSMYIGVSSNLLPYNTPNGNTVISFHTEQVVAQNGFAKGSASEGKIVVLCDQQLYKALVIAYRDSTNGPVKQTNIAKAIKDIEKSKPQPVPPNTLLSRAVDLGCGYVSSKTSHEPNKQPGIVM